MKFKNFKVDMKVRVKLNADSLTKASSNCRYQNDSGVRSAQGKIGVIESCDSSDKTLRVQLDGDSYSNWFDPIHLESVPAEPTLESLRDEVAVCTAKASEASLRATVARETLADFVLKTKVYSFEELASGDHDGMYRCTDLQYESRFLVTAGTVLLISGSGTHVSTASSLWDVDTFTKIDASYQVTITENA